MDQATLKHYITSNGVVFDKETLVIDIGDRGFVVSGIDFWVCKDLQLVIETVEELHDEVFEIRWETDDYLGYIRGESEIFLYINPLKSIFSIPKDFVPPFPAIPNLVKISNGKPDFEYSRPVTIPDPKEIGLDFPKYIVILENFNYLDQDTQRFISELSQQVLMPFIAQVNYDEITTVENLISDYERFMSSALGLVSDEEYIEIQNNQS